MTRVGDVIAGKYVLERVVGSGGMGVVFAARHAEIGRVVAVKLVRAGGDLGARGTERLLREARAAALLKSPHVAAATDAGTLDDGSAYLVMDLLRGTTLQSLVKSQGPLAPEAAAEYVIHTCHGLGEAHAHGIVHRDVKPSNLFLLRDADGLPCVKVIDFGISKARSPGTTGSTVSETNTGALLGSPPFMSPEQIRTARDVDARSDIWSLGITLYYLLCGELPFRAESLLDLMTLIAYEQPLGLRDLRPDVPAGLADVAARCMCKRREERFPSMAELGAALAPFAPQRARAVAAAIDAHVVAPPADDEPPPDSPELEAAHPAAGEATISATVSAMPSGARRTRWGVLSASATAIAVVTVVTATHRPPPAVAAPASSTAVSAAAMAAASQAPPELPAPSPVTPPLPSSTPSTASTETRARARSPRVVTPVAVKSRPAPASPAAKPSLPSTPD